MTAAIFAAISVLLIVVAIAIIVIVIRSGRRRPTRIPIDTRNASELAMSTEAHGGPGGDSQGPTRRRFFGFVAVIAACIGALIVKLWSMQVISGAEYTAKAEGNRINEYTTIAPRGRIFDRNGVELVGNRSTFAVLASADVQNDKLVIQRLSDVLGIPRETIASLAASQTQGAQADRLIALDVDDRAVAYISEHPNAFPGVRIESRTVRTYPNDDLAAHVLGYTGTISQEELKREVNGLTYESGDIVGKDGVEQAFESYLQGDRGIKRVEVNAAGEVVNAVDSVEPVQGNDIRINH